MEYKSPIQGWRQYQSRYCLQGVVCKKCEKTYFPKKYLCRCGSKEFKNRKFNGKGTLVSFTSIANPSEEFKNMSVYCIGLIQLVDGPLIMAQISDAKIEDLKIGMSLKSSFRRFYSHGSSGVVEYGIKFVLCDE